MSASTPVEYFQKLRDSGEFDAYRKKLLDQFLESSAGSTFVSELESHFNKETRFLSADEIVNEKLRTGAFQSAQDSVKEMANSDEFSEHLKLIVDALMNESEIPKPNAGPPAMEPEKAGDRCEEEDDVEFRKSEKDEVKEDEVDEPTQGEKRKSEQQKLEDENSSKRQKINSQVSRMTDEDWESILADTQTPLGTVPHEAYESPRSVGRPVVEEVEEGHDGQKLEEDAAEMEIEEPVKEEVDQAIQSPDEGEAVAQDHVESVVEAPIEEEKKSKKRAKRKSSIKSKTAKKPLVKKEEEGEMKEEEQVVADESKDEVPVPQSKESKKSISNSTAETSSTVSSDRRKSLPRSAKRSQSVTPSESEEKRTSEENSVSSTPVNEDTILPKGYRVAGFVSHGGKKECIVVKIDSFDQKTKRYRVADAEPSDPTRPRKWSIRIPDVIDYCSLSEFQEFKAGDSVYAVFVNPSGEATSVFYQATIARCKSGHYYLVYSDGTKGKVTRGQLFKLPEDHRRKSLSRASSVGI